VLLDESLNEDELRDMGDTEMVCRYFLEWDLAAEQLETVEEIKHQLSVVLGRQLYNYTGEQD